MKLGGAESKKNELYGSSEDKWKKVDNMEFDAVEDCIESVKKESKNIEDKRKSDNNKRRLKELLDRNLKLGGEVCKNDKLYGSSGEWEKVDGMFDFAVSMGVKLVERENSELEKDAIKSYNELAKMIVLGAKEQHLGKAGKKGKGKGSRIVFYNYEFPDEFKNAYTDVFKFGYMSNGKRDEYSVRLWKAEVFKFGDAKIGGEGVIKKMNEYKKLLGDKI